MRCRRNSGVQKNVVRNKMKFTLCLFRLFVSSSSYSGLSRFAFYLRAHFISQFVFCFLFVFSFSVCSFFSLQFSPFMLTTSRGRFVFFVASAFHSDSGFNPPLPPHASVSNLASAAVSCMTQPQLTGGTAASHSYVTQLEWTLYDTGICKCWCDTAGIGLV